MHSIISLSLNTNKGIDPWLVNQKIPNDVSL